MSGDIMVELLRFSLWYFYYIHFLTS
jgi:hypothetical protein